MESPEFEAKKPRSLGFRAEKQKPRIHDGGMARREERAILGERGEELEFVGRKRKKEGSRGERHVALGGDGARKGLVLKE